MKKIYIFTMAVLAAAACAKHEVEIIPEQPAGEKTWTVEVNAVKGADDTTKAALAEDGWEGGQATKALYLDGSYLQAYWGGTDVLEVYKGDSHLGTLTTTGGGNTCRFRGTLSGFFTQGQTLQLYFQYGASTDTGKMFEGQKGTLEDIAKRFDYAFANATVKSVDNATSTVVFEDATFQRRQSINQFTFSYDGAESNKITKITITSAALGLSRATVIPEAPRLEFFIALPGVEGDDKVPFDFLLETENGTVLNITKKAKLVAGKYYKATFTLSTTYHAYDSAKQPLTIEALADGKVTIQNPLNRTLYYGFEGVNNSAVNSNIASGNPIEIEVKAGDMLLLGGKLSSGSRNWSDEGASAHIICDVPHYAYGNVMSLIDYEGYRRPEQNPFIQTAEEYAFSGLFWQGDDNANTTMYNHPEKDLVLPATTVKAGAYRLMFFKCVNLTRAPELPATTFLGGPYTSTGTPAPPYGMMFMNCVNINQGPSILPALSVPRFTYWRMFDWCISLEASPVLPAPAPENYAYMHMFYSCRNLKQITCYATSNLGASGATYNWVENVPAGGTFISDPSASWPSGNHGIPAGWNGFVEPLTIEAVEDGVITISNPENLSITYGKDVSMSMATTSSSNPISINVSAGEKVRLWGDNPVYGHESGPCTQISGSGKHNVSGDIRSLISRGDYVNVTTLSDHAFRQLFFYDTKLVSAQNLVLGAGTMGKSSYLSMFEGCTGLTQASALEATTLAEACYAGMFAGTSIAAAPALPVTTLAPRCYEGMFQLCANLTSAPALPATALAEGCYMNMFDACTSLTQAPELNAPTLVKHCYAYMFRDCALLSSLKCLATNPYYWSVDDDPDEELFYAGALSGWLEGTAATGTFTRASGIVWPQGVYGVPTGWTITP